MSLPATIPAAILDTVLGPLAVLFLTAANGNAEVARQASLHLLNAYDVRTEQELFLAAELITFSLHGIDALRQSLAPDLPLARVLRLRGNAVSLNREAHRSRKALLQLQAARGADAPQPEIEAQAVPAPQHDTATELASIAREAIEQASKHDKQGKYGGPTYAQDLQKRLMAMRIAENSRRNAAEYHARMAGEKQPVDQAPTP